MNNLIKYILFILGIILSSTFYTLASYYFRYAENKNIKFIYIFILSIIFGIISYMIKIPTFYYFGKDLNIMIINIYFLVTTFIIVTLYSKFILNENIPSYTYIILILIILLIILNNIMNGIHKK
jgi:hypothetical protein